MSENDPSPLEQAIGHVRTAARLVAEHRAESAVGKARHGVGRAVTGVDELAAAVDLLAGELARERRRLTDAAEVLGDLSAATAGDEQLLDDVGAALDALGARVDGIERRLDRLAENGATRGDETT